MNMLRTSNESRGNIDFYAIRRAVEDHFSDSFDPVKAVGILYEQLLHRNGRGTRLYFPLTAMYELGEFTRGAMEVMESEVGISMLTTPVHDHETEGGVLDDNIRRTLAYSDGKIIVVDHSETNTTYDRIRNSVRKVCAERKRKTPSVTFVNPSRLTVDKQHEFQSTYEKNQEGELVLSRGEMLQYFLENPTADPERFRNGADNFQTPLVLSTEKYFTKQEAARLMSQVRRMWDRDEYNLAHTLANFVRSLPAKRQRQIVAQLHELDTIILQAAHSFGVDAARDYQATRA